MKQDTGRLLKTVRAVSCQSLRPSSKCVFPVILSEAKNPVFLQSCYYIDALQSLPWAEMQGSIGALRMTGEGGQHEVHSAIKAAFQISGFGFRIPDNTSRENKRTWLA
jgi:protein subunit release factor B